MQKRLLQLHYEESKVWFSYSWNQYHVKNFLQLYLKQFATLSIVDAHHNYQ